MMKYLFVLFVLCASLSFAQDDSNSSFGIKAGLNYSSNGELKEVETAGSNIIKDKGDARAGYHVGFYSNISLGTFYLRPEAIYTKTTSEYPINGTDGNYKVSKIDVPVLLGYKIAGPLSVFAGPAFQYIIKNEFDAGSISIEEVKNEISAGLHIGAGIQLGNLGLDIRYERGFSENEAEFVDSNTNSTSSFTLDSRPTQLIFSVSFKM